MVAARDYGKEAVLDQWVPMLVNEEIDNPTVETIRQRGARTGRKPSILIVEDVEAEGALAPVLRHAGYEVAAESSATGALSGVLNQEADVLIIDDDNEAFDAVECVRRIRTNGLVIPIMLLASDTDPASMIDGYDAGADSYTTKPIPPELLQARLRALHRRSVCHELHEAPIRVGDLNLEPSRLLVRRGETEIPLTPAQLDVLRALMDNVGHVLTRDQIADHLRNGNGRNRSNVIDVHIRALRSKLDQPSGPSPIETVRGLGYRYRLTA